MTDIKKINKLTELLEGFSIGTNGNELYKNNKSFLETVTPDIMISAVDTVVKKNEISMPELKMGINKILNLLFVAFNDFKSIEVSENSFLDLLKQDNRELEFRLKSFKGLILDLNKKDNSDILIITNILNKKFTELLEFDKHYLIKENILFPILEKEWKDYRCLQVMWSFHDDIRNNLKSVISICTDVKSRDNFDIKEFNKIVGKIFFDMNAIIFREEKILFPIILETISNEKLENILHESLESGFAFIKPKLKATEEVKKSIENNSFDTNRLDLQTGLLTLEQIKLIFNHLPVDITYVDENDEVRYFSNPKKRIFHRTKSIIGRKVNNCHPKESVHTVEEIVDSFRNGKKDVEEFYLKIKGEYIYIQYFAVRDSENNYKGVIEVSQDITHINELEGEKRLL